MTQALLVYVTAASRKEADKIAQALVEEREAACVSIVPEIYSRYWWGSRLEYGKELLLIIKTTPSRYKAVEKRIREIHSYSEPEILAVPVVEGSRSYLKWLKDTIR